MFSVFINGLLREVEEAEIGIEVVEDFCLQMTSLVLVKSKDQLQTLIDVVHAYCRKWRLRLM